MFFIREQNNWYKLLYYVTLHKYLGIVLFKLWKWFRDVILTESVDENSPGYDENSSNRGTILTDALKCLEHHRTCRISFFFFTDNAMFARNEAEKEEKYCDEFGIQRGFFVYKIKFETQQNLKEIRKKKYQVAWKWIIM